MNSYKHFATISSQVYFCSSPIRIDSYNRCQFGCTYCFSRSRSADTSSPGLKLASPGAFEDRLARVSSGDIRSAFDEFLRARIPIQLGGTQDPFGGLEAKHGTTLKLLQVLQRYRYPTIISTKSTLVAEEPYVSTLKTMNALLRFSAAGVRENCRNQLEIGCPAIGELMAAVSAVSAQGLAVSLRIQPVIPGHEAAALRLAERAAQCGVKHISFEYLKIGTEDREKTVRRVSAAIGEDVWSTMERRGLKRIGRDYTLTTDAKSQFVRSAKETCTRLGVKFGAGDTEFIHLSDGRGCCNGSEFFLGDCAQFRANFVGVLTHRKKGDKIRFSDLDRHWQPALNVHAYLTTNSRGRCSDKHLSSWMSLVARRWNGGKSPYSPSFFFGVVWKGEWDEMGYKVYEVDDVF
jgi:DNA repair photolyase